MYLHLLYDKKFAKGEIDVFEKYYPGESLYVFTRGGDKPDLVDNNVMFLDGCSLRSINKVAQRCEKKIDIVFVYNASDTHCILALYFNKIYGSKIHWMFFGSELYDNLYYRFNYKLIDEDQKSIFKFFLDKLRLVKHWPLFKLFASKVDRFCSWNIYDYKLLKEFVNTPAKFVFYTHDEGLIIEKELLEKKTNSFARLIQINHSASWDGNHLTILKKIASLDPDHKLNLLIPISYGDNRVKDDVVNYVETKGMNVKLQRDFLLPDDYFRLIGQVDVAIFGHHRQEGGGNIVQALKQGTKVFLREDNNLLQLYRDWGIIVFSFEKDLNSIEDLITPLSLEDQRNNFYRIQYNLSQEKVSESMKHFFD